MFMTKPNKCDNRENSTTIIALKGKDKHGKEVITLI